MKTFEEVLNEMDNWEKECLMTTSEFIDSVYQIVRPIEETDDGWGITGETAIRLIHEAFNRAPTIIEADKTESEDGETK